MKIDTLAVINFKGLTLTEKLGAQTIITGKNFRGKTGRLQAIQLALLGYVAGFPKTNPGVFQLSSGAIMEVAASGEGFSAKRVWKKTGRSIEKTETLVGLPDKTDALIAMMDAEQFLNASEPDKLAMIFSLAQISSPETTESLVSKMPKVNLPDWDADNVRDWINLALPHAIDQRKFAKQAVDRLEKTQQGMESLAESAETISIPAETVEKDIANLEASKKPIEAKLTEIAATARNYGMAKARYERELAAYNRNVEGRKAKQDLVKKKPALEADISACEKKLAEIGPRGNETVFAKAHYQAVATAKKADALVGMLTEQLQKIELDLKAVSELDQCPHCHSKGKGWRKYLEETIEEKKTATLAALEKAHADQAAAVAAMDAAFKELEEQKALSDQIGRLEMELNTWRGTLRGILSAEQDLLNEPQPPEIPASPEDTSEEEMELGRELQEIDSALAENKTQLQAVQQAQARKATAAHACLRAQEALAEKENWIKAVEVLEEARQKMIDEAFAELLKLAFPVYEGILESPLTYIGGSLGRMKGVQFIPMNGFSGTEALVATIALQVALGAKSPAKIVLLDEMGRLDPDNKNRLIQNLHGMIQSGLIEQWIAIDVTAPVTTHADITHIAV